MEPSIKEKIRKGIEEYYSAPNESPMERLRNNLNPLLGLISSYKLSDGLEKEESLHDLINHINEMNVDDIYNIFNDIPKECR